MPNNPRGLTRDELAKFLPSHEAVIVFERLLASVNDLIPSDVAALIKLDDELYELADSALAIANNTAIGQQALQETVAYINLAPSREAIISSDNLTPAVEFAIPFDWLAPAAL